MLLQITQTKLVSGASKKKKKKGSELTVSAIKKEKNSVDHNHFLSTGTGYSILTSGNGGFPPCSMAAARTTRGNPHEYHRLQTIPRTGKTPWPQKPCIVCKQKDILRKSRYFCVACVKNPGFCRTRGCFADYHRLFGYYFSLSQAT